MERAGQTPGREYKVKQQRMHSSVLKIIKLRKFEAKKTNLISAPSGCLTLIAGFRQREGYTVTTVKGVKGMGKTVETLSRPTLSSRFFCYPEV